MTENKQNRDNKQAELQKYRNLTEMSFEAGYLKFNKYLQDKTGGLLTKLT